MEPGTPRSTRPTLVYEGKADDMSVGAYRDLTPGFERDFVTRRITFYSGETFLRRDGKLIKIEVPDDAEVDVERDGGSSSPADRLGRRRQDLSRRLADRGRLRGVSSKGGRSFDVLFEPTERKSLAGFSATKNHFLLNELDNIRNRLYVLTHQGRQVDSASRSRARPRSARPTPRRSTPDESDDYFLTASSYLTPMTLEMGRVGGHGPGEAQARTRRSSTPRA